MGHFGRHSDGLSQRGVWVNGLADVHGIRTHFDGQRDLTNHVARMRSHHAATQDLAMAMGLG